MPQKNERPLAGKTLIEWARDAAVASGAIDRVVVSTDSEAIANLARSLEIEVPFMRPAELASDEAPMFGVIAHAVSELEADGYRADAIALLQPTSPARTGDDIRAAVTLLERSPGATSVVSVAQVPAHFAPHWVFWVEDGELKRAVPEGALIGRRQDVPPAYYRDGTIYLSRRETIVEGGDLYGSHVLPLLVDRDRVVTIDTPDDWERAERLLGGRP